MELFEEVARKRAPLSERMRPRRLDEMVGQSDLLAAGGVLRSALAADRLPSMILWGPPGSGKTTLARALAQEGRAFFVPLSAVMSGVPELRRVVQAAEGRRTATGPRTLLFIDEIHRFNKAQQDALLPHVEAGTLTLIGATTENPSFAVNHALLSRARVMRLEALSLTDIDALLVRALADSERGLAGAVDVPEPVRLAIAEHVEGDARRALDTLELLTQRVSAAPQSASSNGASYDSSAASIDPSDTATASLQDLAQVLGERTLAYDRKGEEHYNVVSAFIKSMRGSDPDAAIYWMMRMLEGGEDPRFIVRRMLIFASEDVGNADPRALAIATATDQAFERLGMPEGTFALAQCCTYLACAPKSNASYKAWTEARDDVRQHGALPVPLHLRNAPTQAMKEWGYGAGYRYPHNEGGHAKGATYLPEKLGGKHYYRPLEAGFERRLREHLAALRGARNG